MSCFIHVVVLSNLLIFYVIVQYYFENVSHDLIRFATALTELPDITFFFASVCLVSFISSSGILNIMPIIKSVVCVVKMFYFCR